MVVSKSRLVKLDTEKDVEQFLNSVTDGIFAYDQDWRFILVNQAGAAMVGKTPTELIGKCIWDIYSEAIDSAFYQECHRAVREQTAVHIEHFCSRLNCWFYAHAYPSEGGLFVIFQDITDRKQSEAELQQSYDELEHLVLRQVVKLTQTRASLMNQMLERLRAETALQKTNAQLARILETITDGFCAFDRQWRYSYVNRRAEQILKKHQGELLGKRIWDVYPLLVGTRFYQQCHEVARLEVASQLEEFFAPLDCWLQITIYPSAEGLSVYFQDITRRKQAEAECHQLLEREQAARIQAEVAEQRSAFLSEASRVLASSLDYETTLASVAQAAIPFLADYCLIQRLDTDGQLHQMIALHHDPQKQQFVTELAEFSQVSLNNPNSVTARVLRTQEPLLFSETSYELAASVVQEPRLLELYQELNPTSAMILPLIARGHVFGCLMLASTQPFRRYTESDLALGMDLACRAAMAIDNAQLHQRALESNRLKDEFFTTLSHELRTPLHGIFGWASVLSRRALDENLVRQGLDTIERKARDLIRIIYNLLDTSHIIKGRLRLNVGLVNLETVVQEAMTSLELAATAKSIQISTHIQAPLQPVLGDPDRLRQIVWNLLSNAIKFTPAGGQVEMRLAMVEQAVQLQIEDTGQGIHPDFLPFVFEPFRQADSSITRTQEGMGLGLSLVRYLVEMHGGTIEIFSAGEAQGTTVTVCLPAAQS